MLTCWSWCTRSVWARGFLTGSGLTRLCHCGTSIRSHSGSSLALQFVPTHPTRCCGAQESASLGPGRVMSPCQAWPPGVWHVVSLAPVVGSVSLGGVHTSPTGLGLRACAPVRCSVILLAQGLTVVPCDGRGCLYPLPGGVAWCPSGSPGAPHLCGVLLPYGCGWQACGYTLAGSPLGPSAALSPRSAAQQHRCSLPQLRVGTSLASADRQWGTQGSL